MKRFCFGSYLGFRSSLKLQIWSRFTLVSFGLKNVNLVSEKNMCIYIVFPICMLKYVKFCAGSHLWFLIQLVKNHLRNILQYHFLLFQTVSEKKIVFISVLCKSDQTVLPALASMLDFLATSRALLSTLVKIHQDESTVCLNFAWF